MAERLVRQPGERARLELARTLGVSYKRLHGWEPREFHDHEYDDAGRLVRTVVSREAEWDDEERNRLLALAQYEAGVCNCGYHESLTSDPTNVFVPRFHTCPVCQGGVRYLRSRRENDEQYREAYKNLPTSPELSDGRSLHMELLSAAQAAAVRERQPQSRRGNPS